MANNFKTVRTVGSRSISVTVDTDTSLAEHIVNPNAHGSLQNGVWVDTYVKPSVLEQYTLKSQHNTDINTLTETLTLAIQQKANEITLAYIAADAVVQDYVNDQVLETKTWVADNFVTSVSLTQTLAGGTSPATDRYLQVKDISSEYIDNYHYYLVLRNADTGAIVLTIDPADESFVPTWVDDVLPEYDELPISPNVPQVANFGELSELSSTATVGDIAYVSSVDAWYEFNGGDQTPAWSVTNKQRRADGLIYCLHSTSTGGDGYYRGTIVLDVENGLESVTWIPMPLERLINLSSKSVAISQYAATEIYEVVDAVRTDVREVVSVVDTHISAVSPGTLVHVDNEGKSLYAYRVHNHELGTGPDQINAAPAIHTHDYVPTASLRDAGIYPHALELVQDENPLYVFVETEADLPTSNVDADTIYHIVDTDTWKKAVVTEERLTWEDTDDRIAELSPLNCDTYRDQGIFTIPATAVSTLLNGPEGFTEAKDMFLSVLRTEESSTADVQLPKTTIVQTLTSVQGVMFRYGFAEAVANVEDTEGQSWTWTPWQSPVSAKTYVFTETDWKENTTNSKYEHTITGVYSFLTHVYADTTVDVGGTSIAGSIMVDDSVEVWTYVKDNIKCIKLVCMTPFDGHLECV